MTATDAVGAPFADVVTGGSGLATASAAPDKVIPRASHKEPMVPERV
ncbi:hypothetical protein [Aeromonas veronii]|nr:hypothetical protein [Aeromonas veronii]MCF5900347.1 hypothetical protein [Aeromonas veronii]